MGSNFVENGPVELFNTEAEAGVRCVKDFIRWRQVGALGCQESGRFEFLAPCRSRAEEDAPASLCILIL
jgi:hypothetical protein